MKDNVITHFGLPQGADMIYLKDRVYAAAKQTKIACHIGLDDRRAQMVKDLLAFFAPDIDVVIFPAWDCLPYDRVSPHGDISAKRIQALTQILSWRADQKYLPRLVITTINAVTQRVVPQSILSDLSLTVKTGQAISHDKIQGFLEYNGYIRNDTVRDVGEYSFRGSIIDIYSGVYDDPIRIDTFGDDVENIKFFDPLTQRSKEKIDQFSLIPARELILTDESRAKFRQNYREMFQTTGSQDPLYEAISDNRRYNGAEHWLPLFYDGLDSFFDYLPDAIISIDDQAMQASSDRFDQIEDFFQARLTLQKAARQKSKTTKAASISSAKKTSGDVSLSGSIYHPLPCHELYLTPAQWDNILINNDIIIMSPNKKPDALAENMAIDHLAVRGRDFTDIRALSQHNAPANMNGDAKTAGGSSGKGVNLFDVLRDHLRLQQNSFKKVGVSCLSAGSMERFKGICENAGLIDAGIKFVICNNADDFNRISVNDIALMILPLEQGFETPQICLLTENDILGDRLVQKSKKRKKADQFLTEVSSLSPGDLVVHMEHGIGRFDQLETLKAAGTLHDCLQITYHGGDRLFVPVENIDVLSRFGSDEGSVQLDKLGGAGWQARKAKVKKDLMAIAEHLLAIAAERHLKSAEKIEVSQDLYGEFTARFPYVETDDQRRAIDDVLDDLSSGRPMDRLVCGDVGFGKTEVALRAAYIAAMNGLQVAVVVPTTLLARQHFMTFQKRFEGMGLRVEQLSRMVSPADMKRTKERLRDGLVNIVVGTHALLAETIKFDNLGLLIIDEEQKFGVKQKERLKQMRSDIHVLTLSATPIPRTLQLSLTGVKELSLITTPPIDRLAVRSFILPYDPVVIREALMREHYRGGQSFYVCPRVSDLQELEEALKVLVPEIKTISAHGQLSASELEDRMNAFYDRQYGILLATNIIESGLDIPNANTMIVHRADMFGLGQLYQIRGRIGRSKARAYAYMTYLPNKKLSENALKRLEVMETLDSLGAGFQLASHDMDIRGAGNLLGEEQSGHIKEVGIELYQQMLEDAVADAKNYYDRADNSDSGVDAGSSAKHWSPQINMGTSVLIPDSYVEDLNLRMSLYRRLGALTSQDDVDSFAAELIDRFGDIPVEVQNLLDIVEMKQLCRQAGIVKFDAGPKGAVVEFFENTPSNPPALLAWITEKRGTVKLRPDQKISIIRQWDQMAQRVKGARSILREIASL